MTTTQSGLIFFSPRSVSMPSITGMLTSSMIEVGLLPLVDLERLGPVRRLEDPLHAEVAQEERDELPDVGLVVDEQDASAEVHLKRGRRTTNSQPRPGMFSTPIVPRCASTILRQMARPSPVLFSPPVGCADRRP